MPMRVKKLLGFALLLPALAAYFFAAAALGERVPNFQLLKVSYFLVAGIAWVFPYLMVWMNAEPRAKPAPEQD